MCSYILQCVSISTCVLETLFAQAMFADVQHLQALAFTKTLTPYRISSSTTIGDHAVNTTGTIPDVVEFGGNT